MLAQLLPFFNYIKSSCVTKTFYIYFYTRTYVRKQDKPEQKTSYISDIRFALYLGHAKLFDSGFLRFE